MSESSNVRRVKPADIRAFRARFNLNQQQLADLIDTTRATVSRWEDEGERGNEPPGHLWRAMRDLERELITTGGIMPADLSIDTDAQQAAIAVLDRLVSLGVLYRHVGGSAATSGTIYYGDPSDSNRGMAQHAVASVSGAGLTWHSVPNGGWDGPRRLEEIVKAYNRATQKVARLTVPSADD